MSRPALHLREDRGAVLVMVTLWLPILILFITFVVDVGNWFEHKRHLQVQADAGALAGGGVFRIPCADDPIESTSRKYGGDPGAADPYNLQVAKSDNVHMLINSIKYWNEGGSDYSDGGGPCSQWHVDVKMTQANLPWFFGLNVVPAINAHARVEIRQVNSVAGALPVGVPDVNPNFAFAKLVDESLNGVGLAGCTAGGAPVPNCEFPLTKQPTCALSGLACWNNSAGPVSVPIASGRIGVRIRLVGGNNSAATCGQVLVECYDQGSTNGVVFIRGYQPGVGTLPSNPPAAGDVTLFDGTCTDPYFTSDAASCTVGVHAKMAFPLGVGPSSNCQGNNVTGACVTAVASNGQTIRLTYNAVTGYWDSTGSNFFNVAPGAGPLSVDLRWQVKQTGITINGGGCGNGQGCQGTIANAQRMFGADPARSGPLKQVVVSEGGSQWKNSFQLGSTHNLVIQIALKGSLKNAADANDPVVLLRVVKDNGGNGSQNQSVDCDPQVPNLREEIRNGCAPQYTKNTGQTCPATSTDLWGSAQPWNCVAIQTGGSIGQMTQGIQDRILCGGQPCSGNPTCTAPNNWSDFPDLPEGDPRIVPVFLTPFGTFSGSGNAVVPVTDFAVFYVTGWGGNGNGNDDPCPGADPAPSGDIAGHFIKYVQTINNGSTGSQLCDPNAFAPCVAILTE
jgi:Putative Flp pilus-assembly TadE/G-like